MASVPIDGDQDNNSEPLKYKTWVLKVSIHCEGCKRKVKRILHSVEGVYTIDVDARQHKVVVTGNVDANTLVRKLEKSGKHAELWPDFHKVSNNNQINEQQQQQQQQQEQGLQNQNQNPNVDKQKVTFNVDEPQKTNNESQKGAENCGPPQQQPQQVKEVRFEGNVAGEPQKPPANNPGGGGGEGAAKKKKKKKKGQNGNNTTNNPNNSSANNNNNNNGGGDVASVVMEQGTNGGPPSTESLQQQQPHPTHNPNHPVTMSPPRHYPPNGRVYEYPPPYYAPPPVYGVSYNTAYPSSSYSASYYSAPPPYSYAYVHQGGDVEASAPLDWNPRAVPPSDSFEMFSDENPNACAVM